jgi:dipeptidyl aminopeptidase/acylaminoacyl peptidase
MRVLFFSMAMLLVLPSAFCQNSIPSKSTTANFSEQERWNLDKYVWSHTRYKTSNADKPVIDFDAIDNWIGVGDNEDVSISPDGKYFAYGIRHTRTLIRDSMVVQSTENDWRMAFVGASPGFFSGDNKQYIFQVNNDLYFLNTHDGKSRNIENVANYNIPIALSGSPQNGVNKWLAYQIQNNTVILVNLIAGKEQKFDSVTSYSFDRSGKLFVCQLNNLSKKLLVFNLESGKQNTFDQAVGYSISENGKVLLLKTVEKNGEVVTTKLLYVLPGGGDSKMIWSSANPNVKINSYSLDGSGKQVVMSLSQNGQNSIWYWKEGMDSTVQKINDKTEGIDKGLYIQGSPFFSNNGRYIQFALQPPTESLTQMPDAVEVDVWSSQDVILQSTQRDLPKGPEVYNAIFSLEKDKIVFEEKDNKKMNRVFGDFAIMTKSGKSMYGDRFWESGYYADSCWVVSLKNGNTRLLPVKNSNFLWVKDNYIVCFDSEKANYYSYNTITGKLMVITAAAKPRQLEWTNLYLRSKEKLPAIGVPLGWIEEHSFLVYDNYDIWQLDLEAKKPPINITNSYGHSHQISLQLSGFKGGALPIFPSGDTLLLKAFNRQNKSNGFYRKVLDKAGDPEKLYMGPYLMAGNFLGSSEAGGLSPVKAALADRWIILRQSATESPNYFVTNDFKEYKQLTQLQPQKRYNWLTAELHSFKQLDGTLARGILYKPENFDPKKKYPVLITFYAELTDQLHEFFPPHYIDCPSIFGEFPWMVSLGYLVFIPDLYFTKGEWGPSTVNTMDGAAKYLNALPYVDGKRLGVGGHSNSGRFGYYLLTHSKMFAAMSIGEGATDLISTALDLMNNPTHGNISLDKVKAESNMEWAEIKSVGTGLGNLWSNKQRWLDHTAVLNADKVTSPVLIMDNKNELERRDAVEMFSSLRRLEKPVWWLHYENGLHRLMELKDSRDFTIRYTQFFDHYLKEAPMPVWMKEGFPYKLKGVESRYELVSGSVRH